MASWYGLRLMVILLALHGCATGGSRQGQVASGQEPPRFSKAADGVISDAATGLEWYVNPNRDQNWHEAKAWTENLAAGGGGWRLPTVPELRAIYQKGAAGNNMDPAFQTPGVWVWSGQLHNQWSAWGFAFYNGLEGWHAINYGCGRQALAVRPRR